ncbi:MAG TPA: endonuclease, partial [Candidatus Diapherotrites archaeon]|nr:endonuclease [Candidatus Diapherotrites archaeon]
IFHDKVSVIDSNAFSTGSFNYTGNADSGNAENLVIVKDEKLAQAFEEEFLKYWNSN